MTLTSKNTFQFIAIQGVNLLVLKENSFATLCLYPKEPFYVSVELNSLLQGSIEEVAEVKGFTSFYGNPTAMPTLGNILNPSKVTSEVPLFPQQPLAPAVYYLGPINLMDSQENAGPSATNYLQYGLYNFTVEIWITLTAGTAPIKFKSPDPRIVVGNEGGGLL